jgi:hypothetical protein
VGRLVNAKRLHSAIGHVPPDEYESMYYAHDINTGLVRWLDSIPEVSTEPGAVQGQPFCTLLRLDPKPSAGRTLYAAYAVPTRTATAACLHDWGMPPANAHSAAQQNEVLPRTR